MRCKTCGGEFDQYDVMNNEYCSGPCYRDGQTDMTPQEISGSDRNSGDWTCPRCHRRCNADWTFCHHCNAPMWVAGLHGPEYPENPIYVELVDAWLKDWLMKRRVDK